MPAEFATLTEDDLVTGEGVALDLPAAGLGVRLVSGLLDVIATLVLALVIFFVLAVASIRTDEALLEAAFVLGLMLVFLAYPATVETLTRGRTLGKLAMGLRTVRDDGGPISAQHALVRALIGFVEIYAMSGVPAFFSMMVSRRGKRLGDFAAGTYVVRDRVPLRLPLPPPMPPQLAGWARRADIAALPTGLALAVRQFLGRLPGIDPATRHRVGTALLTDVMEYVAPPPPAGAPPEQVLAAVIAERRERDLARLRREDRARSRLTTGY
ncbi:RDD family protein [Nocardioides panacisoli]|uniref:RDD domain-containing protein n=1 Tax=Nocardioides panacisoli TaxID=627624 RepID=A0ABP7HXD7_9ACTN